MDGAIADLGELKGDVLLYGGCHSNLQATEALFGRAEALGIPPSRRICTGDVVAYGADARATAEIVAQVGGAVVAGNCERQIAGGAQDCGCGFAEGSACDLASRGWYAHARAALAGTAHPAAFAILPDLALFVHGGRRYAVVHGGRTDIARFLWPTSPQSAFAEERAAIEAVAGPIDGVIAGHCGIAFEIRVAGIHWINPGAVGMPPHDGHPATRFAVLGDRGVVVHRLDYDHRAAAAAMEAAGLTQGYERALVTGTWPSEDVLPVGMRRGAAA